MISMYEKLKKYHFSIVPLTEEEWAMKVRHIQIKKLRKNDFLIKEGQTCTSVHFVNKGSFRTYNLIKGKEVTTNFFFDGSYASDYVSYLTQKPSLEYIQALEDCEIFSFPYDRMQEMYESNPKIQKFGRLIAEKIFINMYRRQQEFLFFTPKERYLNLLKRRPKVIQQIPQIYIASYLGITPEYLSRIRNELKSTADSLL